MKLKSAASALSVIDGSNTFMKFDTANGEVSIGNDNGGGVLEFDINTPTIDVSTQATSLKLLDGNSNAIKFVAGSDEYLRIDSSAGALHVGAGSGVTSTWIKTKDIHINDNLPYKLILRGNVAEPLTINDGSSDYVAFKSLSGSEALTIGSGPEELTNWSSRQVQLISRTNLVRLNFPLTRMP